MIVGQRPAVVHSILQLVYCGVACDSEPPRQPIAEALVADIDRDRCSSGVLVESAKSLHEFDRRQANDRGRLADWATPPGKGGEHSQCEKAQLKREPLYWRMRDRRTQSFAVAVNVFVPQDLVLPAANTGEKEFQVALFFQPRIRQRG